MLTPSTAADRTRTQTADSSVAAHQPSQNRDRPSRVDSASPRRPEDSSADRCAAPYTAAPVLPTIMMMAASCTTRSDACSSFMSVSIEGLAEMTSVIS